MIDGKNFYSKVKEFDINRMMSDIDFYSTEIITDIVRQGYTRILIGGSNEGNYHRISPKYRYGDPIAILKECMVEKYNFVVKREVIKNANINSKELEEHYNKIRKSYNPDNLVVGYDFGVSSDEELNRTLIIK